MGNSCSLDDKDSVNEPIKIIVNSEAANALKIRFSCHVLNFRLLAALRELARRTETFQECFGKQDTGFTVLDYDEKRHIIELLDIRVTMIVEEDQQVLYIATPSKSSEAHHRQIIAPPPIYG